MGDLVQPLTELLGDQVHSGFARRVPLWVDGVAVEPDLPAGVGVRHGCVVSLFEPADLVAREVPHGVAELRVVSEVRAPVVSTGCPSVTRSSAAVAPGWSLPDLRLPSDALTVSVVPDGSVAVTAPDALGGLIDDGAALAALGERDPVAGRRVRLRG